jgi:hypothetical protein
MKADGVEIVVACSGDGDVTAHLQLNQQLDICAVGATRVVEVVPSHHQGLLLRPLYHTGFCVRNR